MARTGLISGSVVGIALKLFTFPHNFKKQTAQEVDQLLDVTTFLSNPKLSMDTIKDQNDNSLSADIEDCTVTTLDRERDPSTERDEAAEVRKQSSKETAMVKTWRTLVASALLVTAVAVTATTYHLLVQDERGSFVTVVSLDVYQVDKKSGY